LKTQVGHASNPFHYASTDASSDNNLNRSKKALGNINVSYCWANRMFFLLTLIIITKRLLYLQVERDKKSTAAANAIRENPGWAGAHIFLLRGGTTLGVVCVCAQESKTARNPSHLLPNSTKQRASVQ
jgi:hypothetical protein